MDNETDDIIHRNRVESLRALSALGGTASLREVYIFLERYMDITIDLPSLLYTFESLDALTTLSERDVQEGHTFEGIPPHDVTIVEDELVETIFWAYEN